ncbi:Methyltransferase domain-containing protein [Nocardioides alpinus]|uniref:Methyltransferase domain-containing protein n=1 Tax=Nocardioides alpinus TaxID=748909 RepID=A0A1I1ASG1_9ACTN|nr:methyltransferase domain-containing protein [Nocardioides alpinus]PKH40287.1 methyltransferase domain-containing protein [Nocardioides alpinus]SFB41005.1 Methyltransferase domain-containing protein [Nocardioides alpinus]
MRLPGLGGWSEDPLWSYVYPWLVDSGPVGRAAWRVGMGSDLTLLHEAAAELGTLPAGGRVLDVPTGSGVALRGVRPGQGLDVVVADISTTMLDRAQAAAQRLGVADQVTPALADVGELPFDDGTFDLVVSFTGLHCFPDPHRAIGEMVRVLAPGGVITGSSLFTDTGQRYVPLRRAGTRAGILGPMCTSAEARAWLGEAGCDQVDLALHGALGYFRAVRGA